MSRGEQGDNAQSDERRSLHPFHICTPKLHACDATFSNAARLNVRYAGGAWLAMPDSAYYRTFLKYNLDSS